MPVNLNFKIEKKHLYLLSAIIIFLIGVGIVIGYGGTRPSIMGHDAGELEGVCKSDGTGCPSSVTGNSMTFEIYNPDTTTYACVQKDLTDYCADADGCDMKVLMQHELAAQYDQVRIIEEHIYCEQTSLSNNNDPSIYCWNRQLGGADYAWRSGTRDTLFYPWEWMWAQNYIHDWCEGQVGNGPAFTNPYEVNFMSHPHVRTTIIVYD